MKQTQKSKNQQNRGLKNIWNAHKELFSVLGGVRFKHMYHFPLQTKEVSEAAEAMEGYCEKEPWNISIGHKRGRRAQDTRTEKVLVKPPSGSLPPAWNACTPQCLISLRPDSKQPFIG